MEPGTLDARGRRRIGPVRSIERKTMARTATHLANVAVVLDVRQVEERLQAPRRRVIGGQHLVPGDDDEAQRRFAAPCRPHHDARLVPPAAVYRKKTSQF